MGSENSTIIKENSTIRKEREERKLKSFGVNIELSKNLYL